MLPAVQQQKALNLIPHYHLDGEVSRPRIETIIELQKDLGAIDRELSADDVLDLRFLRAA